MSKRKTIRKTIEVDYMKEWANKMLESTNPLVCKETRAGILYMLEETLHRSGNYRGFKLLEVRGDETRRFYY